MLLVLALVIACAVALLSSALANHTDAVGLLYAKLFFWLQDRANVCLIRKKLPSVQKTNETAHTFIESYSKWFYWVMCIDRHRMPVYETAIAATSPAAAAEASVAVDKRAAGECWIDIGAGAHLPLTRLLIRHGASHVHAVEANPVSFAAASQLARKVTSGFSGTLAVHKGYSTQIPREVEPQPTALIHEIIGTVSSSEGAVAAVVDLLARFPKIAQMIPNEFGTLCVPVTFPRVKLADRLASLIYGGATSISRARGVQCLYNPPKTWMSDAPQLVERYDYATLKRMVEGKISAERTDTTVSFHVTRAGVCAGFYLSPLVHCVRPRSESSSSSSSSIDGLSNNTNWGIEFVSLGVEGAMCCEVGDVLTVDFFSTCMGDDCPRYTLRVQHSNKLVAPVTCEWKGPQDNMMIRFM